MHNKKQIVKWVEDLDTTVLIESEIWVILEILKDISNSSVDKRNIFYNELSERVEYIKKLNK